MKNAFEGLYREGKIIPKEKINHNGDARVLKVFLDDENEESINKEKLLNTFGLWDDDREVKEIIADIYDSRESRKEDINL